MHRALLIQEIVQLIMQNLYHDSEGFNPYQKGRMALYNAALTCSYFLVGALDVLWWASPLCLNYYQERCVVFLVLLRNFLNVVQHNILCGPISKCDLRRFDMYASRIRRYFYQRLDADEDINISAYVHVIQASGRFCILPRLLNLTVWEGNKDGADATKIMYLLSPCLHKFVMYASSTRTAIVLDSLQITVPRISCLTLNAVAFDNHCLSVICSLSQLEEIYICEDDHFEGRPRPEPSNFDFSFFPCLSCKETLQTFRLDWLHIMWSDASTTTVDFPSLKFLTVHSTSIGPIAYFFGYVMVPGLQKLSIRLGPSPFRELIKSTEV